MSPAVLVPPTRDVAPPVGAGAVPRSFGGATRFWAPLALVTMTVLIVVASVWGILQLRPSPAPQGRPGMVSVGSPARVPGGFVTVLSALRVEGESGPARRRPAAAGGSHEVRVRLSLTADVTSRTDLLIGAMLLQGEGIQGSIAPREDPSRLLLAGGRRSAQVALTYVVPDRSTALGIALPGGEVVSVRHAGHPGDDLEGAGA